MTPSTRCPCGSGDTYLACCWRFHSGDAAAPTAGTLMRSRFSAFAVGEAGYLRETWHPSTRPDRVELDERRSWTRLEIIDAVEGGPFDSTGVVEFRAHHRIDGVRAVLRERSSFVRVDGRWYYVSGEVKEG